MTWLKLFGLVALVVRVIVILLERFTLPKIMRTRINRGSDEYFEWEKQHEGETEFDEVLNPRELKS
jgi:hypothetical protein